MSRRPLNQFPTRVVDYFDSFEGPNEYAFLSNFYQSPIRMLGMKFPTGEHAFQALKATREGQFTGIRKAKSPGEAKGRGRKCELRPDWEAIKYDVMTMVVRAKFNPTSVLADELIGTGDALLIEGTYWGDTVWGVDLRQKGYQGNNWLGRILMARRAELVMKASVTTVTVQPWWYEKETSDG